MTRGCEAPQTAGRAQETQKIHELRPRIVYLWRKKVGPACEGRLSHENVEADNSAAIAVCTLGDFQPAVRAEL
jgi:hypothetical protein